MRLTLSVLAATVVHGALFGVAAIVLSHGPAEAVVVPMPVEVEVVAPRPDPIADTRPVSAAAASSRNPEPAAARPRLVRRSREVALVGGPPPSASTASPAVVDAPSAPVATQAVSSSLATGAAAVRAPEAAARGGSGPVSAKPRYLSNPTPAYPIPSRRRREEGIVLLNVQVEADGTPAAVSLNRSCGHPLLDRAALDAVRRWTFEPARAAGLPVSSLVVIPVRFSLSEQP